MQQEVCDETLAVFSDVLFVISLVDAPCWQVHISLPLAAGWMGSVRELIDHNCNSCMLRGGWREQAGASSNLVSQDGVIARCHCLRQLPMLLLDPLPFCRPTKAPERI